MAALSDLPLIRAVDLRQVRAGDLDFLLNEEVAAWSERLSWDFKPSAELVRRFVDMQALAGFALLHGTRVVGYTYYVCEERKGLIGDLYVINSHRTVEHENVLLSSALNAIFRTPFVSRVESQLMLISHPLARTLPLNRAAQVFPRDFMETSLADVRDLAPRSFDEIRIVPWSECDQDEAARVIASSYEGHIDSRINDQYRSPLGARRFLMNIVQYPGCGMFFQPGSFLAVHAGTQRACGICLSSLVEDRVGHVTQICVTPEVRGTGLGYELMRRSMRALVDHGCTRASLTVTSANDAAIELYRRLGFKRSRNFAAYVWESA